MQEGDKELPGPILRAAKQDPGPPKSRVGLLLFLIGVAAMLWMINLSDSPSRTTVIAPVASAPPVASALAQKLAPKCPSVDAAGLDRMAAAAVTMMDAKGISTSQTDVLSGLENALAGLERAPASCSESLAVIMVLMERT